VCGVRACHLGGGGALSVRQVRGPPVQVQHKRLLVQLRQYLEAGSSALSPTRHRVALYSRHEGLTGS
jgi:hypothetical protein